MIYKVNELRNGELTPIKTNFNGVTEVIIALKLDNKSYKGIGYNPTVELKSMPIPIIDSTLITVMLMINRKDKLLFDSIWNSYQKDGLLEEIKNYDQLKIIFINSDTMVQREIIVENKLKLVFREYDRSQMKAIISSNCSNKSVNLYKSKINKGVLWHSDIMRVFMNELNINYSITKEQVLNSKSMISFCVDKYEVENMDFDRMEETLEVLQNCGVKSRGKIEITFSGYELSSLEIFEINDIRRYVEEVFRRHNNLFYFLSGDMSKNQYILFCLITTEKIRSDIRSYDLEVDCNKDRNKVVIEDIINGFIEYADDLDDDASYELLESLGVIDSSSIHHLRTLMIIEKLCLI